MSLGLIVVEVCNRNSIASSPLEELEVQYPEVAVIRTNCLNNCNMCRVVPYAMVDEQRVYAKTLDQCLEQINETIKKKVMDFWE